MDDKHKRHGEYSSPTDLDALQDLKDPNFVPMFLRPKEEQAPSSNYIGEGFDIPPNFDGELGDLTKPEVELDPLVAAGVKHDGSKGPSEGYRERHRAIARYNALGFTNNQICEKLNYSPTAVSLVLKKPWVQAEVAKFRNQYFDADITRALKEAGSDAIKHIHQTILDDKYKPDLKSMNSRWILEKLTGKPKQEINMESNTLNSFMDLLREARSRGEPIEPAILDITPDPENPADAEPSGPNFDAWLDHNLK